LNSRSLGEVPLGILSRERQRQQLPMGATTSNKPTISSTNDHTTDEERFLKAFATSKAFFKAELEKLTRLSKSEIVQLAAKLCEKTNPSSQRSKLQIKSEITTINKG